jgi:hypothetical protein
VTLIHLHHLVISWIHFEVFVRIFAKRVKNGRLACWEKKELRRRVGFSNTFGYGSSQS